ncbi:MAG: hypothetical protein ACTHQE_08325 [Thermomicrobiales bacterium]
MVAHSGTPARPAGLRPLNQPRPIAIAERNGRPVTILIGQRTQPIVKVQDTWIIVDEWWRTPIDRQYFQILLENGHLMTIFLDRIAKTWWAQEY